MPWINKEMCRQCNVCIEECPASAITMQEDTAAINDDDCIRCGHCHDICPQEAVRHDSEKIPELIESNITWVNRLLKHEYYGGDLKKKKELIERIKRHFLKAKMIAEKTIEKIDKLEIKQH